MRTVRIVGPSDPPVYGFRVFDVDTGEELREITDIDIRIRVADIVTAVIHHASAPPELCAVGYCEIGRGAA